MITGEVFMTIVAMRKIQHFSIRKIARLTGMHRATVKKHIEGDVFPCYKKRKSKGILSDTYRQTIDDYLEQDSY